MELMLFNAQINDFEQIFELYQNVINTTFTTWDKNYPSKKLVLKDIQNSNLYVLKDGQTIVAVSYLGKNENDNDNWSLKLKNPLGVARICVNPSQQGKGIGTFFMNKLIETAKNLGADGMHFHVCTKNVSAMKMYEKVGFKNCGLGKSNYGFDFYRYEIAF